MESTQKTSLLLWAGLCLAGSQKTADGTPGSEILRGIGLPPAALGADGDYYLDLDTGVLYGAKTLKGWINSINLISGHATTRSQMAAAGSPAGFARLTGPGTSETISSDWMYVNGFNDAGIDDHASVQVGYIQAPDLTTAILKRGKVLVYMQYESVTYSLPYTADTGYQLTIHFVPMAGKILITRFAPGNANPVGLSKLLRFRYIIIPGGVTARMAKTFPDDSFYYSVCDYCGIPG